LSILKNSKNVKMKTAYLFILIAFLFTSVVVNAQNTNPGIQLANHIADKMKDSLNLTNGERNQVYAINIQINTRKANVRQQYTNTDSIGYYLQRIESKRDTMYHAVLPTLKYLLYKEKKRNLVRAN
jgi:hypothetical protein